MSQRDADAQILEQFLRTMAPPAALTSAYRQRVVLASVDARARILQRRRSRLSTACEQSHGGSHRARARRATTDNR